VLGLLVPVLLCQTATNLCVEDLDLTNVFQDFGDPHRGKSVNGTPITIAKVKFDHGLGTQGDSTLLINLHGNAIAFNAEVGIDDETGSKGAARFTIYVDGKKLADSGIVKGGEPAHHLTAQLNKAQELELVVETVDDDILNDHEDWANAQITLQEPNGPKPTSLRPKQQPGMKIDMGGKPEPEINGPRVLGCSPNMPFLFRVPATGKGPLTYKAQLLPEGLTLDASTGIISGTVRQRGNHAVKVSVAGPAGKDSRTITIECGDHMLARTPPMGWNSWNVWATSVTGKEVRAAADDFVKGGLIEYGYHYVNIDDSWEGKRDASGIIQQNEKFGDIPSIVSYIHSKGLNVGIYSSPGPITCDNYEGSYKHEQQDADTYAKWGIDYLKYDWCGYYQIMDQLRKPYFDMRYCLDHCGRDIVYSICQYGMGDVWNWGEDAGGNLWRTTYDIIDSYWRMSSIGFAQGDHAAKAGPGHWNDPDMLVVGYLGWGPQVHLTRLSQNEQIMHISLWSLLAAPLILGCDLDRLDPWTKALITNHDVIDVDQDPLGKPAKRIATSSAGLEVWARPLADGTTALGLFNRTRTAQKITVTWSQLKLKGFQPVKDLWERRSIGTIKNGLTEKVPWHGAKLYKIGKPDYH
jgi:alpha-galactosidase